MKFAASTTLLLAAALSTLSAAQDVISQASAKPMTVKPGGLVTVSVQMVVPDDTRRKLENGGSSIYVDVYAGKDYLYYGKAESLTFDKDEEDKNKEDKPDKAARPGGKLDLLGPEDITLRSASLKPNNFSPKIVADTQYWGEYSEVFLELPEEEITPLKMYTAIFKFQLGDDWESGNIVPFTVYTYSDAFYLYNVEVVNVIVK